MIIDLDKQFDGFYSRLDYFPISPNAISLYFAILQIAKRRLWKTNLKLSNSILTNKCGLNVSALQRARNELIQNGYIDYKKGKNQNELSQYTIICFDEQANEQALEQADEQANAQTNESTNAHNKLNYTKLFYYLINKKEREFVRNEFSKITFSQKNGIIKTLQRLNLYVDNESVLKYVDKDKFIVLYAAVEELFFSSYAVYLKDLSEELLMNKFLKTEKYCNKNIEDKIGYLLFSLQNYFEFEKG